MPTCPSSSANRGMPSPLLVGLEAIANSFETVNFYGVGNDRELVPGTSREFYKVENTRLEGEATLRTDLGGVLDLGGGLVGGFSNTKDEDYDISDMPVLLYRPDSLGEKVEATAADVGIISIYGIIFFMGSFFKFLRADLL